MDVTAHIHFKNSNLRLYSVVNITDMLSAVEEACVKLSIEAPFCSTVVCDFRSLLSVYFCRNLVFDSVLQLLIDNTNPHMDWQALQTPLDISLSFTVHIFFPWTPENSVGKIGSTEDKTLVQQCNKLSAQVPCCHAQ